jgi:aspartate/methionine/tyrosine aminotransferase
MTIGPRAPQPAAPLATLHMRTQIRDLKVEKIASLGHLASGHSDVITLWCGESDQVRREWDARTRAIIFSTPSNPVGWTASEEDLSGLLEIGRERGIRNISDALYSRLHFTAASAPSILTMAEVEEACRRIAAALARSGRACYQAGET